MSIYVNFAHEIYVYILQAVQNGRKRALEANDVLLKNGISELISTNEGSTSTFGEWRNIKRNKTTDYEHQYYWNHHDHHQQEALSTAIQHPKVHIYVKC